VIYLYISTIFFILFLPLFCSFSLKLDYENKRIYFLFSLFKITLSKGFFEITKQGIYKNTKNKRKKFLLKKGHLKNNFNILNEFLFYKILINTKIDSEFNFPLLYLTFLIMIMSDITYCFLIKKGIKLDTNIKIYEKNKFLINPTIKVFFIINNLTVIKTVLNLLLGKIKKWKKIK